MPRIIVEYVVIGLFVVVLGLAAYSVSLKYRLDAANAKKETVTATAAGYKTYAKEHAAVTERKEKTNHEVREALARHPEWADEPVPAELADLLRDRDTR